MMAVNVPIPRYRTPTVTLAMLVTVLLWGALLASSASAQLVFPRLGLSASPDDYVGHMTAAIGDTFTVYVGAFGTETGLALDEVMVSFAWVVHQVCCGAGLVIVDHEFVGDFVSDGHPLGGVHSTSAECVSADFIPLAVLQVFLVTPEGPGDYLMSAGPYNASANCEGESPIFLEGVVMVTATGQSLPVVESTWSGIKAMYR